MEKFGSNFSCGLKQELFHFTSAFYILQYIDLNKINVYKVGEALQAVTCEWEMIRDLSVVGVFFRLLCDSPCFSTVVPSCGKQIKSVRSERTK